MFKFIIMIQLITGSLQEFSVNVLQCPSEQEAKSIALDLYKHPDITEVHVACFDIKQSNTNNRGTIL